VTDTPAILIVDDDREIRGLVVKFLTDNGFQADAVPDGRAMTKRLQAGAYDLIILDLMLPGEDGLSLCRRLRAESDTPIVMLTARGDDVDRIIGLEFGADDYLPKPFHPRELLARIRAVLRRTHARPPRPAQPRGGAGRAGRGGGRHRGVRRPRGKGTGGRTGRPR